MAKIAYGPEIGILPLQSHEFAGEITRRHVLQGIRMKADRKPGDGEESLPERTFEGDTKADIISGCYWRQRSKEDRKTGSWRFGAWPALTEGKGEDDEVSLEGFSVFGIGPGGAANEVRPVFDSSWAIDDRYKREEFFWHPDYGKLPGGWPVLIVDGQKESEQEMLAFPCGNMLVAHWRGVRPNEYSTNVYDINKAGKLDKLRQAPIDTAWRVMTPVTSGSALPPLPHLLALNCTSNPDDLGFGACYGRTVTGLETPGGEPPTTGPSTGPAESGSVDIVEGGGSVDPEPDPLGGKKLVLSPPVLAYLSMEKGGFLHFGYGKVDKFQHGFNDEGVPVRPARIWTGAIRSKDPVRQGPQRFESRAWLPGDETDYIMAVPHGWSGSDWAWHSYSYLFPPQTPPPGVPIPGGQARGTGSHLEVCFPSMYFVPQETWRPTLSGARYSATLTDYQRGEISKAPAVAAMESFGHLQSEGNWVVSSEYGTDRLSSRCGAGGVVFTPPELGIAGVRCNAEGFDQVTASETWVGLAQAKFFIARCVDTSLGKPVNGWGHEVDSDKNYIVSQIDASGTEVPRLTIEAAGGIRYGTGRKPNGVTGQTGPYNITAEDDYVGITTAGGNQQVNLPQAQGSGCEFSIANESNVGNFVALTPNGGDGIDGVGGALNIPNLQVFKVRDIAAGNWKLIT